MDEQSAAEDKISEILSNMAFFLQI